MKPLYRVKANFIDKHAATKWGRRKPSCNGVMYAHSASLAAAHVIGPDANEVLKAYGGGNEERKRGGNGCWERREGGEERVSVDMTIRSYEEERKR